MLDNGLDCLTDTGLDELCAVDGSWWYNWRDWDDDANWVDPYAPESYCQYTCDKMGLGYPSASPCCDKRGSTVNEYYDYGSDGPPSDADTATDETDVASEPAAPEFGDLEDNGDCDDCGPCEGDCDEDDDVSCLFSDSFHSSLQIHFSTNISLSPSSGTRFGFAVRGWILLFPTRR